MTLEARHVEPSLIENTGVLRVFSTMEPAPFLLWDFRDFFFRAYANFWVFWSKRSHIALYKVAVYSA